MENFLIFFEHQGKNVTKIAEEIPSVSSLEEIYEYFVSIKYGMWPQWMIKIYKKEKDIYTALKKIIQIIVEYNYNCYCVIMGNFENIDDLVEDVAQLYLKKK